MSHPSVRTFARLAALSTLALLLLAGAEAGASKTRYRTHASESTKPIAGPSDPDVAEFVDLMNEYRESRGLSPLVWDRRVAAIAKAHSRDMIDRQYFSHRTPDGLSTWDRLAARGTTYSRAAENIAWGSRTGSDVLRAWLDSPGHRKNIEGRRYTHHGVGKVGTYWTHIFFTPATIASK